MLIVFVELLPHKVSDRMKGAVAKEGRRVCFPILVGLTSDETSASEKPMVINAHCLVG